MFTKDAKARQQVLELEEQILKLRRDFQALEMEWSNAYDKLQTMMQRVAMRARVVEKALQSEEPEKIAPGDAVAHALGLPDGVGRRQAINSAIMRRRGGQL